jgi:cholesterol oxidase
VGANPSHTIAAVAERNIEAVIRRIRNEPTWRAPESTSVRPIHEPLDDVRIPEGGTPPPITLLAGVKFTETMEGFMEPGDGTEPFDFAAGFEYGRLHNISLRFRLTIAIQDIDEFLTDAAHAGVAAGHVFVTGRTGKNGAPVTQGVFNLFVHSDDELRMLYALPFFGQDGQPYLLDGFKRVGRHDLLRVWPATTTLYTAIREGHSRDGKAIGTGVMRLTLSDFARQLTTFRATGTRSRFEALDTLVKFGRMFVGSLGAEFFEPGRTPPSAIPPPRSPRASRDRARRATPRS